VIPLYGFLEGDSLGLLVLASEDETVESLGRKLERSAALRVYSTDTFADIDLRVDLHATAVEELRRVWTEYKQYEAYYRDRERNPGGAKGQEEFMKTLRAAEA